MCSKNLTKNNSMLKLIFLDVDGVVVTNNDLKNTHPEGYYWFNKILVDRLVFILEQTGAKIVVSSSWRSHKGSVAETKRILKAHGLGRAVSRIIGQTPGSDHGWRGLEIREWITKHFDFEDFDRETQSYKNLRYVIIDDDRDMLYEQRNNFVHTSMENGLTREAMEEAIKILNPPL